MQRFASDVAFTPSVKAIQTQKGSRTSYARMEQRGSWETTVTPDLAAFLSELDMFYLGTANAENQPYIQYRGDRPASCESWTKKRWDLPTSAAIGNTSR